MSHSLDTSAPLRGAAMHTPRLAETEPKTRKNKAERTGVRR